MQELAKAQRFETSEIAHVEIYGRPGRLGARMKNISSTGAFLQLNGGSLRPGKGDLIRATVHLHTLGRSRTVDAEVVWSSGTGFGISFLRKNQLLERMFQRD